MRLDLVLQNATCVRDLREIFEDKQVEVRIHHWYDSVTVDGYEGAVTTLDIARRVLRMEYGSDREEVLANILREKVFFPLKREIENPENQCAPYQLLALKRICFTPPPATPGLNTYVALKHAMCLDWITDKI